ncbi:hypothetical protein WME73_39245 [Sorangium sp. So ce302]|uniref:hypothetical protein n=1 Tax=Sorangium sp. So ce302 TaxID=3133297 RepID=UPI003F62AF51
MPLARPFCACLVGMGVMVVFPPGSSAARSWPRHPSEAHQSCFDAESGQTWSEWEIGTTTDGEPSTFRGVVISTARDGKMAWNRFYLDEVVDR